MIQPAMRVAAPLLGSLLLVVCLYFGNVAGWLTTPEALAQAPAPDTAGQAQELEPATQTATAIPGTITVIGEGKVTLEPDIARVSIGVETVTNTVLAASEENSAIVEAVLAALAEEGIADEDIQTSGFSIFAERYGSEGPLDEEDVRYHVSNNVMVTIRQLDAVGSILDAAIEAGANNIYGVEFALDDPSAFEPAARAAAISNAQDKAAELAALTDLSLGQVVSVSEVIAGGGGYYAGNFAKQASAFGGGSTPITPGQLDLVMQLQVSYATGEDAD